MRISTLKKRVLSSLLMLTIVACYSMVALAGDEKLAGEIVVSGKRDATVTVNGDAVKSGRTVFSSSTIVTPPDATAFVNVKNVGKLKIAPDTTMVVSFNEDGITGSIEKGKLTVLKAVDDVSITAPNGKVALLTTGETVSTVQDDDDDDVSGAEALVPVLILGGLIAIAAFYVSTRGDNTGAFVSGTS